MQGSDQQDVQIDGAGPEAAAGAAESVEPGTVRPAQFAPLGGIEEKRAGVENIDLLLDVPLRINVELGRTTMTIADILALATGSVVELDKQAGEPVDVVVNDRVIARGEVVVVDENFGVRLTDIFGSAKRAVSLG